MTPSLLISVKGRLLEDGRWLVRVVAQMEGLEEELVRTYVSSEAEAENAAAEAGRMLRCGAIQVWMGGRRIEPRELEVV